jgi:NitT/TauT family transport system ATP-binding protein
MSNANIKQPLLHVSNVSKRFKKAGGPDVLVLDDVNLIIQQGEVVALLGKSGSGKSTLLRIIDGLISPDLGRVLFHDQPVLEPPAEFAMVFQHFALLPWATVLENVCLGLQARGIERKDSEKMALKAIDVVGLDGYESAYPKELSGGMCQRVGLARALVVEPEVLLMDEPFSALDVLTAENLRHDLIDIWQSQKAKMQSIIIVTHNIEEAVYLADRICIMSHNPGAIQEDMPIDLPHPRDTQSPQFRALVDKVYTLMTSKRMRSSKPSRLPTKEIMSVGYRLPVMELSEVIGLLEILVSSEYPTRVDLPRLAEDLHLKIDDLFPMTETLELLQFAKVEGGDIELTAIGRQMGEAEVLDQKKYFAKQLIDNVPLARHIRQVLDEKLDHRVHEDVFLDELEHYLSKESAQETLKIAINWGRYAELFAFDATSGTLSLENPGS